MTEEVNDRLIAHIHARGVEGKETYGKPLLPFDGRNTLVDAMEEALDTAVYLMKELMEREAIADLLERASKRFDDLNWAHEPLIEECRTVAARLRADVKRSVPVVDCPCSPNDTCCCACDCDCRERYVHEYKKNPYDQEWVNTGARHDAG